MESPAAAAPLQGHIEMRAGVATAYLPANLVFRGESVDPCALAALGAVMGEGRKAGAVLGLGVEIGTGSIKLLGRTWRGVVGETTSNIKIQVPRLPDRHYVSSLNRLLDGLRHELGLSLIDARRLDPADAENMFAGFGPIRDFAYAYGTHGLRRLGRRGGELEQVRILSGDEEGLLAFDAIVPEDGRRPGVVAVEIGTGSTEIVRVAADGRRLPLALALGGETPALPDIRHFLATEDIGTLAPWLESPQDGISAFFSGGAAARELYINPSRASATFRAFAGGGDVVSLDASVIESFRSAHPGDGFAAKAEILLAILDGLGLTGFRAGQAGGLKAGMARLVATGLAHVKARAKE